LHDLAKKEREKEKRKKKVALSHTRTYSQPKEIKLFFDRRPSHFSTSALSVLAKPIRPVQIIKYAPKKKTP
jgi:hypothetical protein